MRFLFFVLLLGVYCLKRLETELILAYLKENDVKYCFFLVCWKDSDKVKLSKIVLNEVENARIAFLPAKKGSISKAITSGYSQITYILDLSCDQAFAILTEASESFKFSLTNGWLIIAPPDMPVKNVKNLFGTLKLRLDMNVKIAVPKNNESRYHIYEIYDLGLEVEYKFHRLGAFKDGIFSSPVKEKQFFQSRRNMTGVLVRIGNVVNFTDELLWKYRNVANYNEHGGLYGLYLHYLFQPFVELLKFHYNVTLSYPWFGYSDNGTDGGLGKLLYDEAIDFQIGGGFVTVGRTPHFEPVVVPYINIKTYFFYRSPRIKKIGAQVLTTFSAEVWYCVLAISVVMGAMIRAVYWVEDRYLACNHIYNFFTSVMTVLGVLTQQGSATFPQRTGGRILFLTTLIFSIWLYNYYTSGLVSSLLNSKPQMLHTFQDLYESPLDVGMEDQAYIHLFVMHTRDRYLKQLYQRKIYGQHGSRGPNIFSAQEGLERVRKGGFAFHTMVYTAYPIISRTFDQEAICDLGEIDVIDLIGAMFLKKKSHYKELFTIRQPTVHVKGDSADSLIKSLNFWSILWESRHLMFPVPTSIGYPFRLCYTKLWESGLSKWVHDHVIEKRPECRSNLLLTAVGPQELFLIYAIFVVGIFLAIVILLAEIFYYKLQTRKRVWHWQESALVDPRQHSAPSNMRLKSR